VNALNGQELGDSVLGKGQAVCRAAYSVRAWRLTSASRRPCGSHRKPRPPTFQWQDGNALPARLSESGAVGTSFFGA